MGHQTKAKIIPNKIAMVTYAITAAEVVLLLAQRWVIFSTLWRTKMKKICPTRRYITEILKYVWWALKRRHYLR